MTLIDSFIFNRSLLLYSNNPNREADMQWRLLFQDEAYSNYSCFEVDRQNRLAIIGGLHGNIKAISLGTFNFLPNDKISQKIYFNNLILNVVL